MSYYRKPRTIRTLTDEQRELWLDAIRERIGTSLRYASEIYADANGRVYAGSEYVAQLGITNHPADATAWADNVHAIDYGKRQA